MTPILKVCKVWGYIDGMIEHPDLTTNQYSAENWDINNKLAKLIVLQNIKSTQLHYVGQALFLAKVWTQLKTLHQPTGYCTVLVYMHTLYHLETLEEENISDFINKMKKLIDEINSMRTSFKIDNATYGGILTQVLPLSWEQFIDNLFRRDAASD